MKLIKIIKKNTVKKNVKTAQAPLYISRIIEKTDAYVVSGQKYCQLSFVSYIIYDFVILMNKQNMTILLCFFRVKSFHFKFYFLIF